MIFSQNVNNEKGILMSTKTYKLILSTVTAASVAVTSLSASEVTAGQLTNFEANTTAKASEVNGNFTALQAGINDNNSRLTTIENNAQGGVISISQQFLHIKSTAGCEQATSFSYTYFATASTSDSCTMMTGLSLPDKSTITDVTCTIQNNNVASTNNPAIVVARVAVGTWGIDLLVNMSLTGDDPAAQILSTQSIDYATIDNTNYAYSLEFYPGDTSTSGSDKGFYNCTLTYEYQ